MSTPTMIWSEAIAQRVCVSATYNGVTALLAPHVLYLRGEQPYVAAVALERRGMAVADRRVGIFAVAGLGSCTLTDHSFVVDPGYDPADSRYAGTALLAIEVAPA